MGDIKKAVLKHGLFSVSLLLCLITFYDTIIEKPPVGVHVWRQTDCISITKNYAEGANFLEPEMHLQFGDNLTSGKSAGEFPGMYYLIGKLYQVFGDSYFLYRLFMLCIIVLTLVLLYRLLSSFLNSNGKGALATLFLFSSPVFVFYGISFLTDVPAFCFGVVACFFLWRYYQNRKVWYLYIYFFLFALAGLLKISSLIPFVFLLGIFALEIFGAKIFAHRRLFHHVFHTIAGILMFTVLIFGWYFYASWYNEIHGFKYTFNSIYPLWVQGGESVSKVLGDVYTYTSYSLTNRLVFVVLGLGNIYILLNRKKLGWFLWLGQLAMLLGSAIYFLLWSRLMGIHDYYYTPLLFWYFSSAILSFWLLSKLKLSKLSSYLVSASCVAILLYSLGYSLEYVKFRGLRTEGKSLIIQNAELTGLLSWTNWFVKEHYHPLNNEPLLQELGIKRNDLVVTFPDPSFNASLVFLNRKGWTNFKNYQSSDEIQNLIDHGAKFLIVTEESAFEAPVLKPFMDKFVGNIGIARVYNLQE